MREDISCDMKKIVAASFFEWNTDRKKISCRKEVPLIVNPINTTKWDIVMHIIHLQQFEALELVIFEAKPSPQLST